MDRLPERLREAFDEPDVASEARDHLARAQSLGMLSDWHGTEKELDFSRLVVAVNRTLAPGGSIETGVLYGGTSALLIMSCAPGAFHLSIDPYGLLEDRFWGDDSLAWETARGALRRLHQLADDRGVNYSHYLLDSQTFIRADLLRHPGRFNIVHLDGDHSFPAVTAELLYFTEKLTEPVVFIMDDHDDTRPGVGQALTGFRTVLTEIFHRQYDRPPEGIVGFSAWLYPGRPPLAPGLRLRRQPTGIASRLATRLRHMRK
jgi:hypothetical protein